MKTKCFHLFWIFTLFKSSSNPRSSDVVLERRSYDDSTAVSPACRSACSALSQSVFWPYITCCMSSHQVLKVPTSSSTTCPKSLETRTCCRCSCLLETWSLPKSSSTNRQTLASASVRKAPRSGNKYSESLVLSHGLLRLRTRVGSVIRRKI